MSKITVNIPPEFDQALNELVAMSKAPSREVWLGHVVRNLVFDYQIRKDFGPKQEMRYKELSSYWPLP
ncbi:MAG TPA: hypothetical protein VHN79_00640 [Lacunisphaera sp.]|nr:hypothetical protein [Lacunisphaera sp.]